MTKFILQDEIMKNAAKQLKMRFGGSIKMRIDGQIDTSWELRKHDLCVDVTQHADGTQSVSCFFPEEQEPLAETQHLFKNVSNVAAAISQILESAKADPLFKHLQIENRL